MAYRMARFSMTLSEVEVTVAVLKLRNAHNLGKYSVF